MILHEDSIKSTVQAFTMREKIEVCLKTNETLQWHLFGLQIPLKKNKLNELLKHGVILRIGAINFFKCFGL